MHLKMPTRRIMASRFLRQLRPWTSSSQRRKSRQAREAARVAGPLVLGFAAPDVQLRFGALRHVD
ncbi:hypothetical protein CS8_101100 [Cupriavidus sp. 8B]